MSKVITSWRRVRPGDIISFRYKGGKSTAKLVTILVLNPKIRLHQNKQFYLVGLKLEEQGVIPHIRNKSEVVELLERIGVIEVVDFAIVIHEFSAFLSYVVIALHVGATLYSRFKGEGLWNAMVPVWQETGKNNSDLIIKLEAIENKTYEKIEEVLDLD